MEPELDILRFEPHKEEKNEKIQVFRRIFGMYFIKKKKSFTRWFFGYRMFNAMLERLELCPMERGEEGELRIVLDKRTSQINKR